MTRVVGVRTWARLLTPDVLAAESPAPNTNAADDGVFCWLGMLLVFLDGVRVKSVDDDAPKVNGVGLVVVDVVVAPNVNGLAVAAGCWVCCPNVKPVDGVEGLVAPNANGAGFGASAFVVGVSKIDFSYIITIFLY